MKEYRPIFVYLLGGAFLAMIGLGWWLLGSSAPQNSRVTTSQTAAIPSSASTSAAPLQSADSPIITAASALPAKPLLPIVWTNLPPTAKPIKHVTNAIPGGSPVAALVQVGAQYFELAPNQLGEFDQIRVAPQSTLHVSMAYPQGDPGDVINLEIEDGGTINGKGFATVVQLGDDHQIHFDFKVNQEDGVYRVEARSGGDTKMLNFWVDPQS